MLEAVAWGALAASSLLVGMAVALYRPPTVRVVGLVLGFGAGALLSAIAFELTDSAIETGSERILAAGMLVGALTFIIGTRLLERGAGPRRGDEMEARAIILGALLDGVPESLTIGGSLALAVGGDVSLTLVVAVALSNFPEAVGATTKLVSVGHPVRGIVGTWLGLVALSAFAAGIGYLLLDGSGGRDGAWINAFAAGAVLAMVSDTMTPDAHRDGGRWAGLAVVLGFAFSFLIG